MKKELAMAVLLVAAAGCTTAPTNPFFADKFGTPHEIPPFEKFTINDYREGLLKGLEAEKADIQAIIDNPEAPSFENVIVAMDESGRLLSTVEGVFGTLSSSDSDEAMRNLEKEIDPLMTAHSNDIYLNDALFAKVKQVYDNQASMNLNKEQAKLLDNVYRRFVKNGALLSEKDKETLRDLNNQLSAAQLEFSQNLLHETNETYVIVDSRDELPGLPEANVQQAADLAKRIGQEGKFAFNMQRPSCNPVLQYCSNRELRKKVYDAYNNRGNQDNQYNNKALCTKIVNLRISKAHLMGYEDFASMALEDRMAKNSKNVYDLLDQVWAPAVKAAKAEIEDIKVEMAKDGISGEPERWDYMYYLDKAMASKFNIDQAKISEYLEINNVQ
ncbi:MAG: peptidase M3, partial [Bacteroidales bacterium]|nr:peptidase M3 [Bacteroidales bacterium]